MFLKRLNIKDFTVYIVMMNKLQFSIIYFFKKAEIFGKQQAIA